MRLLATTLILLAACAGCDGDPVRPPPPVTPPPALQPSSASRALQDPLVADLLRGLEDPTLRSARTLQIDASLRAALGRDATALTRLAAGSVPRPATAADAVSIAALDLVLLRAAKLAGGAER